MRVSALLCVLLCLGADARSDGILGCWLGEERQTVIELVPGPEGVRGRVVGLAEPLFTEADGDDRAGQPRVDLNNPDISMRARALAGLYIIEGLRQRGDVWEGGSLYDPRSGDAYSARAELVETHAMTIQGWIGFPAVGITTRWYRPRSGETDLDALIDTLAPYMPADAPPPTCAGDPRQTS